MISAEKGSTYAVDTLYSLLCTLYSTPVTAGDADIRCCCRVMMGGIPLIVEENIGVQPDGS